MVYFFPENKKKYYLRFTDDGKPFIVTEPFEDKEKMEEVPDLGTPPDE